MSETPKKSHVPSSAVVRVSRAFYEPRRVERYTQIVVTKEDVSPYPHCVIPPHFYERALYLKRRNQESEALSNSPKRPVLSIQTWDGRDVMAFLTEE